MNDQPANDTEATTPAYHYLADYKLNQIRELLASIEQPKIRYNPDPLIMANEAVARCRNMAAEILSLLADL